MSMDIQFQTKYYFVTKYLLWFSTDIFPTKGYVGKNDFVKGRIRSLESSYLAGVATTPVSYKRDMQ